MSDDRRVAAGMARQMAALERDLAAGRRLIGWKVGFGAPGPMARLGIGAPLIGYLTDAAVLRCGAVLDLADYARPVVEPEIAVQIGDRLGTGASIKAVRDAIAGLAPAIEIADVTFPPDDVEAILAGNIYQRGVMFGATDRARAGGDVTGLAATMEVAGEAPRCTDDVEANTGRLIEIVATVADTLGRCGHRLEAGHCIIAGSVVPPVFVTGPGDIRYRLAPYDALEVSFAGSTRA